MIPEVAGFLVLAFLALLFVFGTSAGVTLFAAAMGFFVVAVLIVGIASTLGLVMLGLVLLEPGVREPLEAVAPWYLLLTSGAALFGGVLGAVRAIRVG